MDFIDENSSLIIFRYVNNALDKIILNFEKELIKEINENSQFNNKDNKNYSDTMDYPTK